ncbi:fluoride efflux transporter CrcB [Alkalimonas mucilaginosa]|uniref:Fluoride-specific ion channel FluC n=1 Tax=Alkalimonas mucilaginosa TaxID=3057676 RepID=A0ABU7JCK9_9GAMM|nr:fluoride efflux transporter CrcB [Alkalimonas sp. MEB004]MEE2023417.1 fluoride efflux transporter CrcB [Alkalimonas sp. MEB004]
MNTPLSLTALEGLLFFLAAAGGGMLRFWLSNQLSRWLGMALPWGTLAVNVSGAFAIGYLVALLLAGANSSLWLIVGIGFLGAYTTVSSFSWQSFSFWHSGRTARAMANVMLTLLLGIIAVAFGFYWGQG